MQLGKHFLPGTDLKVSVVTAFDSESLGGETSSTSKAHKGIKPKEINVSFQLAFKDSERLSDFYKVAQATDSDGKKIIYDVTERGANAANVRQAVFDGRIDQREQDGVSAWRVTFQLSEVISVAEQTEQRQTVKAVSENTSTGSTEDAEAPVLSGFEKVLKNVDDSLA